MRTSTFRIRDVPVIVELMLRGIHDFVQEVERLQPLKRRTRPLARPAALIVDGLVARLLRAEERMAQRVGRLCADHVALLMPSMSQPAVAAESWKTAARPRPTLGRPPGCR